MTKKGRRGVYYSATCRPPLSARERGKRERKGDMLENVARATAGGGAGRALLPSISHSSSDREEEKHDNHGRGQGRRKTHL